MSESKRSGGQGQGRGKGQGQGRGQGRGQHQGQGRGARGGPGGSGGSGRSGARRGGPAPVGGGTAGPRRAGGSAARPNRRRRANPPRQDHDVHDPDGVRLQKLLAGAGFGSRRACEKLIEEGRIDLRGALGAASKPHDLRVMLQQRGIGPGARVPTAAAAG